MDQLNLFEIEAISDFSQVIKALKKIRSHLLISEMQLHRKIKEQLEEEGISYIYEYKLGTRNRVDFLTAGGTLIEAKKRKPNQTQVMNQLTRYAEFGAVQAIVLVSERSVSLPETLQDKPCHMVSINQNWGIAVK